MHESVTYSWHYHPKSSDFTEAILEFFDSIELHLNVITRHINDNFQRVRFA